MAANPNKLSQFRQELKRRKVIKVIGMYAATAFIIMEAGDIMLPRLGLPDWTVTLIIILLIVGFPITIILSWIFDITSEGIKKTESIEIEEDLGPPSAPVKRRLKASDIVITMLVVVVIVLAYPRVFKKSANLRAMTIPVTIVNELGEKEIRRIFKENYVTKLAIFPFVNESNDSSNNWVQYGIMDAIIEDQKQFNYILIGSSYDDTHLQSQVNNDITHRQEQIKYAKKNNFPHFLTGTFRISDGIYEITSKLYQTENGAIKEERIFIGSDFFSLIDSISLQTRIDLGITKNMLNSCPDLPINEQLTNDLDAFRYYEKGIFLDSRYFNWNKAIELDSTFSMALYSHTTWNYVAQANYESARKYINQAMRHRQKLSEYREIRIRIMYYSILGETDKAIALAEMQYYDLQPNSIPLLFELIKIYSRNFMIHKREKATQQLNEIVSDHPGYQIMHARSCLLTGKLDKGLEVLEKLLNDNPNNTEALLRMGQIYLHKNDLETAEKFYQKAILFSPENEKCWSKIFDHIDYAHNNQIDKNILEPFTGNYRFEDREISVTFFIHNNYLIGKAKNQYGSFLYPVSDTEFTDFQGIYTFNFVQSNKGLFMKTIHKRRDKDYSSMLWKEDSLILNAGNLLISSNKTKVLSAFRKAYDQNPEHFYLATFIQHLVLLQSQEYEKLKLVWESYIGEYGTLKIFNENGQFFYETSEGHIFKLLPIDEYQFMIPSRLNSLFQIEKEGDNISGLRIVYRNGEDEFYPRSSEQALASQDN